MTVSLLPRKVRRYDGGPLTDPDQVTVPTADAGLPADSLLDRWLGVLASTWRRVASLTALTADLRPGLPSSGWADATAHAQGGIAVGAGQWDLAAARALSDADFALSVARSDFPADPHELVRIPATATAAQERVHFLSGDGLSYYGAVSGLHRLGVDDDDNPAWAYYTSALTIGGAAASLTLQVTGDAAHFGASRFLGTVAGQLAPGLVEPEALDADSDRKRKAFRDALGVATTAEVSDELLPATEATRGQWLAQRQNAERVGFVPPPLQWQGAWSRTTEYSYGDVVGYLGSLWAVTAASSVITAFDGGATRPDRSDNWTWIGFVSLADQRELPAAGRLPLGVIQYMAPHFRQVTEADADGSIEGRTADFHDQAHRVGVDGFGAGAAGSWTHNPGSAIREFSAVDASANDAYELTIRRDVYRSQKGSTEADNDELVGEVTIGSTTQTLLLTLGAARDLQLDGIEYLNFRGKAVAGTDVTAAAAEPLLASEALGSDFVLVLYRRSGDGKGTVFLGHAKGDRAWTTLNILHATPSAGATFRELGFDVAVDFPASKHLESISVNLSELTTDTVRVELGNSGSLSAPIRTAALRARAAVTANGTAATIANSVAFRDPVSEHLYWLAHDGTRLRAARDAGALAGAVLRIYS